MKRYIRKKDTVQSSSKSNHINSKSLVETFKKKYPKAYEVLGK